jgi:hypothetical protein
MSVSRKSKKNMKKSSKRSKNIRNSKKTRKNMKKMRGGGKLNKGVNQAVDFIISSDNEVLVCKNTGVTGNDNLYALLGTFASSSILKDGVKTTNPNKKDIDDGILEYNKSQDESKLFKVEPPLAALLLQKDLTDKKFPIDEAILNIINTMKPVKSLDDKYFFNVSGDINLKLGDCAEPNANCVIKTQLFSIKVSKYDKHLFETDNFVWKRYNDNSLFEGHKELLREVFSVIVRQL